MEKIKGVRKLATSAETFEPKLEREARLFEAKKVALELTHVSQGKSQHDMCKLERVLRIRVDAELPTPII